MATSGLKGIKQIDELNITDKKVFLRLDLNVPMQGSTITDDTRIREALPTIRYCLEKRAKLVVASHLGRPEGFDSKYSLEPVAERLSELLNADVHLVEDPASETPHALLAGLKRNQFLLLENVRFIEGEQKNDEKFARTLAEYTEVYINDAFGASHRAHSTIDALPRLIAEKGIGLLMKKEIDWLDKILNGYENPYIAVLGGSKVSDKIGVLDALMEKVDIFIIGGAMAYTFLAAQRHSTGNSRVEKDRVTYAREFMQKLEVRNKTLLLPVDHCVVSSMDNLAPNYIDSPSIPEGKIALDIGPKTAKLYAQAIRKGKTVFWNGPMGMFEKQPFERGTYEVAKAVSECPGTTIVGGGDSVSALQASGFAGGVSHISTGGGASLEYLQGDKLAGLEVLRARQISAL